MKPLVAPAAVRTWLDVALELNKLDHTVPIAMQARAPGPTATAYMLGLVSTAMADAVASFPNASYKHFKEKAAVTAADSLKAAIGGAAYAVLTHIYDQAPQRPLIEAAERRFLQELRGQPDGDVDSGWGAGEKLGRKIARNYWKQAEIKDATAPDDYRPHRGEHDEDPDNEGQKFYGVRWAELIPALVLSDAELRDAAPPKPPDLTDQEYAEAWIEVKNKGERGAVTGTNAEEIGLFWAYDGAREIGTPPRLYNQHIIQIAEEDGIAKGDEATWGRLFALCNLALADAGKVSWAAKYEHRIWRPIRAIRNVDGVALPPTLPEDAGWCPYGSPRTNPAPAGVRNVQSALLGAEAMRPEFTPNFPAYTSGHATFGAAAFTALRLFRAERGLGAGGKLPGDKLNIELASDELKRTAKDHRTGQPRPNRTRHFRQIQDVIDENAESRIFLGVHWRFDSDGGVASGDKVAQSVFEKAYPLDGK